MYYIVKNIFVEKYKKKLQGLKINKNEYNIIFFEEDNLIDKLNENNSTGEIIRIIGLLK